MPPLKFKETIRELKNQFKGNKKLQGLEIPKELGEEVDMILGIKYIKVYPKFIHTFPNGLQILKSQFLRAMKG